MKTCSKCGATLSDEKFCSNCGTPNPDFNNSQQIPMNNAVPQNPSKSAKLIQKFKALSKTKQKVVIGVVAFILLAGLAQVVAEPESDVASPNETTTIAATEATTEKKIDKSVKLLMDTAGFTEAEANEILNNLKAVGITKISSLKIGAGTGIDEVQSFAFSSPECSGTLTFENRKIYHLSSGNIILYDKGKPKDNLSDYVFPESTDNGKIAFGAQAQLYVEQFLKAPSTAKHQRANEMNISRHKDIVTVSAYVDSQNSFGAMIRSNYVVQMKFTDQKELLYLQIDDNVCYGKYQKP